MPAAVAGRQGRVRVWPDRPFFVLVFPQLTSQSTKSARHVGLIRPLIPAGRFAHSLCAGVTMTATT